MNRIKTQFSTRKTERKIRNGTGFKVLKGIDRMEISTWFPMVGDDVQRPTKNISYPLSLVATRANTDLRKNFFSKRLVAT